MASTIIRQPMTAHQLVHAIHALSRLHLYTLKAVECLPEKEQEAAAEKVISELRAFIDKSLPKDESVKMNSHKHVGSAKELPPRERDIQNLHNLANAAVAFADQLANPVLDFYQLQKSGTGIELKNALTVVLDEDLVRPESVNYSPTSPQRQQSDYKTPYGHKFSCLSKLALQLADIVESKDGQTFDLKVSSEHRSICMLIDMLVDAGVLPLNSVKKLDGISLSQLQSQLVSVPNSITISSPAVTITSSNGIVTAGIDSLGLRDES